jgi:hypothetical protein
MNTEGQGIDVTMHLWVDECATDYTLVHPHTATYNVSPPVWCSNDKVALEMHLDHLAKLQFLFDIRRSLQRGEQLYQHLKDRNDFIVRGMMKQYQMPACLDGKRNTISFDEMRLRAA